MTTYTFASTTPFKAPTSKISLAGSSSRYSYQSMDELTQKLDDLFMEELFLDDLVMTGRSSSEGSENSFVVEVPPEVTTSATATESYISKPASSSNNPFMGTIVCFPMCFEGNPCSMNALGEDRSCASIKRSCNGSKKNKIASSSAIRGEC